jgi:hypothetical protein
MNSTNTVKYLISVLQPKEPTKIFPSVFLPKLPGKINGKLADFLLD